MKRKKHTLRADHPQAAHRRLSSPLGTVAYACRTLEVSEPTYHRWQQLYGGMNATEEKRLKDLAEEKSWLKRLLADADTIKGCS